ncbi:unnamed protein product [Caenorhabditis auriculariae]|uniref:Uncharacterized protein n=1 Tax=Caenorhabditis auriculariae TaxID=2777116 RepID=A0A8S1H480_9PELO|nr:unnamed protein product [Caenorhabditis auriculariae]
MSCSLFVPEVRGSRRCSVCRCDIGAHEPAAIYVQPQRLFAHLPPVGAAPPPGMRMTAAALSTTTATSSLAPSENSAFSPYSRSTMAASSSTTTGFSSASSSLDRGDRRTQPPPPPPPPLPQHGIIRPTARLALAPILPKKEDRSGSNISKKIRSKRKDRPSSVGILDTRAFSSSPVEEDEDDLHSRTSLRSSPVPAQRSNDFKLILQRFQSADKRSSINNNNSNFTMSPAHQNPGWSPPHRVGSQDSWSPAHRSSLNSNYRDSPVVSRNTSARSRLSISSIQSPHGYLPTRDSSPRSLPSPSLVPLRRDSSPDLLANDRHSPLSHTGSTPEPRPDCTSPQPPPLTVAVNSSPQKRHSLRHSFLQQEMFSSSPPRWIKETDVDEPSSLPTMSPMGSSSSDALSSQGRQMGHKPPIRSAPISKRPSMDRLDAGANGLKNGKTNGRYGGSCRRVLSGVDQNSRGGANGVYVRRSRSKDDRPSLSSVVELQSHYGEPRQIIRSPPRTSSIPIFLSHESIGPSRLQSPLQSPPIQNPPKNLATDNVYKHFQQMALSHVHTLTIVADKLSDEMRKGEEPVSRNRLAQLDFSSFIVQSPHPILTKGKSLFYNAVLPRSGATDFPVTLMIAPCSQYAPLMRKSESNQFELPAFLEIEDHDGAIKQFLYDTGTQNLDGRNTKVIAMPRLNLCSFHSLAAHQLNQRIERSLHEELVSFILLQLLSALKMLQGEGVESLSTNFKEFLLAYRYPTMETPAHFNEFPRLLFLPETLGAEIESGGDELVGLCRYALRALCTLLHHRMDGRAPPIKLRSRFSRALMACAVLLQEDKSSSLTKAKNVLELSLWSGGEHFKNEQEARVWIDMARAECIDSLLRQLMCEPASRLGPRERFRVEFLLSATPRAVMESQKAMLTANIN